MPGLRLRSNEAPGPRFQDAKHDRAESEGGQDRADEVEPGSFLGGRVVHAASQGEDHEHDEYLPDEHPSPRGVGGEDAADQRPSRNDQPNISTARL